MGHRIYNSFMVSPKTIFPFTIPVNFGSTKVVCLHLFLLRLGLCCHLSNSKHQAPPRRSSGSTKQPALMALSRAPFAKSSAVVPWQCPWCPWCPWCRHGAMVPPCRPSDILLSRLSTLLSRNCRLNKEPMACSQEVSGIPQVC